MKEKTHINFQIRISLANTILNYTQNFLLQICSSEYLHNILSLKLYLERENHLLMCFYSRSVSNWIILHIVIIPQTCFSKFGTKHVINMFCERKCFYVIFLYFEKLFFLNVMPVSVSFLFCYSKLYLFFKYISKENYSFGHKNHFLQKRKKKQNCICPTD